MPVAQTRPAPGLAPDNSSHVIFFDLGRFFGPVAWLNRDAVVVTLEMVGEGAKRDALEAVLHSYASDRPRLAREQTAARQCFDAHFDRARIYPEYVKWLEALLA